MIFMHKKHYMQYTKSLFSSCLMYFYQEITSDYFVNHVNLRKNL